MIGVRLYVHFLMVSQYLQSVRIVSSECFSKILQNSDLPCNCNCFPKHQRFALPHGQEFATPFDPPASDVPGVRKML